MRTKIASSLAEQVIERAQELERIAIRHAVNYASSDDAKSKQSFECYKMAEKELRDMHIVICRALHALEALIQEESKRGAGDE